MRYCLIVFLITFSNFICAPDKPIDEIPFTINEHGLVVVTLYINNQAVPNFILDTGASGAVIDDDLVTQLDLKYDKETIQSIGASGVVDGVRKTQKQRVSLSDEIVLDELAMSVIDLSGIDNINGVIGFDFFREFVTETNFDTEVISFYKRKGKPDTEGYQSIPFVESYCTPEIEVAVELPNKEILKGKVFFDTGDASTPFTFNAPQVKKHSISSKFKSLISSQSRGIHTTIENSMGIAYSVSVDKFKLAEVPITLSGAQQGVLSKKAYMGNLGLDYIRKFNFILNYNKKRIYLKPNESFNKAFNYPLSGISLKYDENGIFIKYVSQPSMAYKKGLRVRQQLISIDGVEDESLMYYKNELKKEGKEVSIVVRLDDGSLKTIKLLLKRLI